MAMVLDACAGTIVSKLAGFVEEKAVTVLGVKDELKKLQRRIERIKHVLHDAERKRIQSESIAGWVKELKDIMYDADDIIDLCRHEGGKFLDGRQPSTSSDSSKVCCGFRPLFSCFTSIPFRHEIGGRIKKLNERLDEVSKDILGLNLVKSESDTRVTTVDPRQTSPIIDLSDIVGRGIEHATNDLVERIVKKDGRELPVIAITGMGGIGKTTLAQHIFNHPRVKSEFSIKIWVCISQNFSEISLLKEIIRGAGGNHGDLQTKAELVPRLISFVSGKTFILVLDDVWRADVWISLLCIPLQSGAVCSRVLVTTRDSTVAMQMGAVHIHSVETLPIESGWELLCKSLFVTGEEEEMQSLRDVGSEIVGKCNGLPLAIKSIAGVLITKERNVGEWEKVLRKDAWYMDKLPEDLRGALYLSYEDLPSHLKQCFIYCSLLPEDFEFLREDLVQYWAAEGFAETHKDSFLEQADEYFEELIRRNLIHKESETKNLDLGLIYKYYKMHDLLRSLAQFLSQDESFCGEAQELIIRISTTTKLRHVTLTDEGELALIPEPLLSQRSLRTLFLRNYNSLANYVFVRFPFLRVLSLKSSWIENIPDAVGKLIHLRLLDLGSTWISSLPESIKYLTNLQVLNLRNCHSLYTLPKGITQLCNLRIIEVEDTPLDFIPSGMGRLKRLNHFNGFVVGGGSIRGEQACSLEDLNSLTQLRVLHIRNLENAVVAQKGQHVLKNKRYLKHLQLISTIKYNREREFEYSEVEIHKIQDVFEELAPPPCLEVLKIEGYFGHQFPSWIMASLLGSLLPHLTRLDLIDCINVVQLPAIGLLPELRNLTIESAQAVVSVGSEFLGSGSTPVLFPKLETIMFYGMPNLQEWSFQREDEMTVFPNLLDLTVDGCPRLESLPRGLKGSPLKKLTIFYADLKVIDNLPYLTELEISECESLERISHLPALRVLSIAGQFPLLKYFEKLDSLERLDIYQQEMDFLPEGQLRLLQERQRHQDDNFHLELICDSNQALLRRCLKEGEYWPIIQNIPSVNVYASGLYLRYTKEPYHYKTNVSGAVQ